MSGGKRRSADEILAHIEQYGVQHKDAAPENDKRTTLGRVRRSRRHRMTLDLHGLHSDEATVRLRGALHRCRENGSTELLVIHGYGLHSDPNGGPVLKKLVVDLLEGTLRSLYRSYRPAAMRDGGDGATLVLIR